TEPGAAARTWHRTALLDACDHPRIRERVARRPTARGSCATATRDGVPRSGGACRGGARWAAGRRVDPAAGDRARQLPRVPRVGSRPRAGPGAETRDAPEPILDAARLSNRGSRVDRPDAL